MSEYRIATRYAKSVLKFAVETNKLSEVRNDMMQFLETCKDTHDFYLLLKNPVIKHQKKKIILNKVFKNATSQIKSLFDVVSARKREAILPEIANKFLEEYDHYMKIDNAEVVTACSIDDQLRQKFKEIAKEISSYDNIKLVEKINTNLIGGFTLRMNDKLWDDSLRGKINKLKHTFSTK